MSKAEASLVYLDLPASTIGVAMEHEQHPTPIAVEAKPLLVSTQDAAKLLGLSPKTLANWRSRGVGPKWLHVSGSQSAVLYAYKDLEEWVERARESKNRRLIE